MSTPTPAPAKPGAEKAERLVLPREVDAILRRAREAHEAATSKLEEMSQALEEADERVGDFLGLTDEGHVRLIEDAVGALEGAIGPCDLTRDLRQLAYDMDEAGREIMGRGAR